MRPNFLRASILMLALTLLTEVLPAQTTYQTFEKGVPAKKRELYFYGMRAYPFGRIPQNARLEALYHTRYKMQASATPLSANSWRQIGPFNIGGRVRSIAVHPTDGKTLWIGAADGGVWKSTDRGDSWTPVMDDGNAISMGALAVDPSNPDVLYAGTGEMSSNIDAYNGAGIFKSIDGGGTWRPVGLTTVGAFSKIVVHSQNSMIVYAGATKNNGGFYRSVDGGNTWKRTFDEPVSDVTVHPTNPQMLWIGTMSKGVWRSTDGGENFTESNIDLAVSGASPARVSVQVAASNPDILYALVYEIAGSGEGASHFSRIYKSTNSGGVWVMVHNSTPNFLNSLASNQGWYNNVLSVSPSDPNVVIAGGVTIVRTTNGGDSWNTTSGPHPDQHAMAFDPTDPQRVYLGNDGGMYRSANRGGTYQKISQGLAITQFYAMGIDQRHPTKTYGGTQDNGTITNLSNNYGEILGGDGFFVIVHPDNSNIIFAENPNGDLFRLDLAFPSNSRRIMDGLDPSDEAAWSAPIVIDPTNSATLWHGRHKLYLTLDEGNVWFETPGRFAGLASAICVSPVNPAIVYAGSDRGELLVTNDQGNSWENYTNAPGMPNRAITDFVASLTDENTAYMVVSGFYTGHIFKTTDHGQSWTDISNGLPDIPANAIALHPEDEKIIYVGTDVGMFITLDGGQVWAPYNQGLPRSAVADLEVHRSERKLRMASHGRSMWEIDLERPAVPVGIVSPNGGEVWMGGTSQVISWSGFSSPVRIEFSLDDGQHWHLLAKDVGGTSFRWAVFDTTSIVARIRVTAQDNSSQTATSRPFTITRFTVGGTLRASQVTTIPYGLVFDGEYLWASDFGSNKLLKLDPNTLATVGTVTLEPSLGPAFFTDMAYNSKKGTIFLHRLTDTTDANPGGWLFEIDKSGQRLGSWASSCTYPIGLVFLNEGANGQLMASDRNGDQKIYILDAGNPNTKIKTLNRTRIVRYGSRGATNAPDGKTVYQAITDFTGDALQDSYAEKFLVDNQSLTCKIELASPVTGGLINVRGIEIDPRDSNLWISDYGGNIYKVVSCDGKSNAPPITVGVDPGPAIPEGMTLSQNMPNPFTTTTDITFTLPGAGHVKLDVYDGAGRMVANLADRRFEGGAHSLRFDPNGLPSGVYRYSMTLDGGPTITKTMIFVR